jgi:hypothetical protein
MVIGKVKERWRDVERRNEFAVLSHFLGMPLVHGQRVEEMSEQSRE